MGVGRYEPTPIELQSISKRIVTRSREKDMKSRNRGKRMKAQLGITILFLLSGIAGPLLADDIFVSGNPGALIISAADAGSQPYAVTDASTSYSIDITTSNKKITGAIDSAMPANTYLGLTLAAPTGATSAGQIILSVTGQDLITGLTIGMNESGLGIVYEFSASVEAGIVPSASKTVTFTIADSS
jgi:hypothetical protein